MINIISLFDEYNLSIIINFLHDGFSSWETWKIHVMRIYTCTICVKMIFTRCDAKLLKILFRDAVQQLSKNFIINIPIELFRIFISFSRCKFISISRDNLARFYCKREIGSERNFYTKNFNKKVGGEKFGNLTTAISRARWRFLPRKNLQRLNNMSFEIFLGYQIFQRERKRKKKNKK